MIMYDHKIFEDMPNNTKNDTCVIFSIITVNPQFGRSELLDPALINTEEDHEEMRFRNHIYYILQRWPITVIMHYMEAMWEVPRTVNLEMSYAEKKILSDSVLGIGLHGGNKKNKKTKKQKNKKTKN